MSNIQKIAVRTTDITGPNAGDSKTITVEQLAGVPAGTEINGEIVVADKDDAGNVIGWHKEPKKGGK